MDHCDPHVARKLSWFRFQYARARMEIEAARLLVFHGSIGSVFSCFFRWRMIYCSILLIRKQFEDSSTHQLQNLQIAESPQVQCCTAEGERQAFRLGGCHGQAEGEMLTWPVENGKSAVKDEEIRAMTSAMRIEQNETSSEKFKRSSVVVLMPPGLRSGARCVVSMY